MLRSLLHSSVLKEILYLRHESLKHYWPNSNNINGQWIFKEMKTGTENYFILSGNHQKSIFHIYMLLKTVEKFSVRAPWNYRWFLPMTNSLKDFTSKICCVPAFVLWSHDMFLSNKENYFYQSKTTSYVLISKHYSINEELH